MLIDNPKVLLFIEPTKPASTDPILDNLTYKLLWAVRNFEKTGHITDQGDFLNIITMGIHHCTGCCDKSISSHSYDLLLKNGFMTNTLAVHYIAFHRDEISTQELDKISLLEDPPNNIDPPTTFEFGNTPIKGVCGLLLV